ncbi:MAG: TonB family protein [Prevotella sp.]|nr:TonB family protein [Prevotella sp.]
MKKLIVLLFLLTAAIAHAQDSTTIASVYSFKNQTERQRIFFHQQQYLRRQGDTLHLVKVDLEWPLSLHFSAMPTLQRFLTKELFGLESETVLPAIERYLASLGEPLTLMPEEPGLRTCYEMVSLNMMEYVEGRYVSLRLVNRVIPKDTAEQVTNRQRLLTYDIVGDRLLTTKEMLRKGAYTPYRYEYMQLQTLLGSMPLGYEEEDRELYLGDMCLMRAGAYFDLGYVDGDNDYHSLAAVPTVQLQTFLNKETKNMLKAEIPERQAVPCTPQPWFSDTTQVYVVAEEMPSFRDTSEDIYRYLRANIRYPWFDLTLGIEGRVVVQFIVEADGSVSSPSVVHSVSPGLDREAVRLIMSMPRWKPARQQGQPVRCVQSLPIGFKITT